MATESNMKLWNAVCETDPAHTRRVSQRGGFTAIDAQSQLMEATQQWGPYGTGWGVKDCKYENVFIDSALIEVTLDAVFYYPCGEFEIGSDMAYRPGNDTRKKLLTDVTTKALSKLGFNADIFLGKYDDNKYVDEMKTKYQKEAVIHPDAEDVCEEIVLLAEELKGEQGPVYIQTVLSSISGDERRNIARIQEVPIDTLRAWKSKLEADKEQSNV